MKRFQIIFSIMPITVSFRRMLLVTDFASFNTSFFVMSFRMIRWSKYFKILNSIILFVTIFMVDYLISFKVSTKVFFHYQSMLKNISHSICIWMFAVKNSYVSFSRDNLSPFPTPRFLSFGIVHHKTFSAHFSFQMIYRPLRFIRNFRMTNYAIKIYHTPIISQGGSF